jgi:hypothetical protein
MEAEMYEGARCRDDRMPQGLARLGNDLAEWLRSRPVEQWLMFAGGLVLGLLIG